MKRYNGILICSDYDGTFSCGGIPERNKEALRVFTENGGLFTLCTGRGGKGLDGKQDYPINAPMIGLSGGEIYDFASHAPLIRYPIDGNVLPLLRKISETIETKSIELCFGTHSIQTTPDEIPSSLDAPLIKVVFFTVPFPGLLPDGISDLCRGTCEVLTNGGSAFELTAAGHDKGAGALYVKHHCRAQTLIGVGDQQGDLSLLRDADIGIAVQNAHPVVKEAADRVVCHAAEGAIADIIESL